MASAICYYPAHLLLSSSRKSPFESALSLPNKKQYGDWKIIEWFATIGRIDKNGEELQLALRRVSHPLPGNVRECQ